MNNFSINRISSLFGLALLCLLAMPVHADHERQLHYVVPGDLAWEVASQSGFTFHIQYGMCFDELEDAKCVPDGGHSAEPHDGYNTHLGLARFDSGAMIVERFATRNRDPRSYVFTVFDAKDLADGWELADIEMLGTYVIEEAEFRSDGPSDEPVFKVRIRENRSHQASAKIKTMTLIGPADGQWQDAFRKTDD